MKNVDIMLILITFFVCRIIALSAGYADALCLVGLLAFKLAAEYLRQKQTNSEVMIKVESHESQIHRMNEELQKVKTSSEGIKAAFNLTSKR
jgi:hypothetical protein